MGWDSCDAWKTKADVIAELLRLERIWPGTKVLAYKSTSKAYYAVVEKTDGTRILDVALLERHGGCYSVKSMGETMGPYGCDDCPLEYLDMVPEPNSEYAKDWRKRVRAHWAAKEVKRMAMKRLAVGGKVRLIPGCKYGGRELDEVTIVSVKPLEARTPWGALTGLKKTLIAEVL